MAAVASQQSSGATLGDASRPSTETDSSNPLQSSNTSMQAEISEIQRGFDEHSQWLKENAPERIVQLFQAAKERNLKAYEALAQEPLAQLPQDIQELQNSVKQILVNQQKQAVVPAVPLHPKQARILSWAQVAAQAPSSTPTPQSTLISTRASTTQLLIRPTDENGALQGLSNKQITHKVQAEVQGAVTARKLPSGDIKVTLENPTQKAAVFRAQGKLKEKLGVKVLRDEFPVEVLGVPTSFQVPTGSKEDSTQAIEAIKESTVRLIQGFEINRLNWIHGKRSLQPKKKGGPERKAASLILWLSKEEFQKAACLRGVVIDYELYTCRLYHPGLQLDQCFKCQGWGHRQTARRSRATCRFCAKGHSTNECPDSEDPSKAKCANCGQHGHPAWRKEKCVVYKKAWSQRELLRSTLLRIQQGWIEESWSSPPPLSEEPPTTLGSTASSLKRSASSANLGRSSQDGTRRRPPGRPKRADLSGTGPSASQPAVTFSRTIDLAMADTIPQSLTQPTPHAE